MAQSEDTITNQITVRVLDVVTREPLRDYGLFFINEEDTLKMHIDSVDNMHIETDESNYKGVIVFKEGYDTLSVDLDSLPNPSKIVVEFYLPKLKLTRKEKRIAHNYSNNLPPSIFDESPCFDKLRVTRREFLIMRFYVVGVNEMVSSIDIGAFSDY